MASVCRLHRPRARRCKTVFKEFRNRIDRPFGALSALGALLVRAECRASLVVLPIPWRRFALLCLRVPSKCAHRFHDLEHIRRVMKTSETIPDNQFDDKEGHISGSKPGLHGSGAATMNDSQPKSSQGGGADPADVAAGSMPEADPSGGGAVEGLDTGAKGAEAGGDGGGGGSGGDENAAEDRGLEGGGDGGGGGGDGEGGGTGGGGDGANAIEQHGIAEEVRLSKHDS